MVVLFFGCAENKIGCFFVGCYCDDALFIEGVEGGNRYRINLGIEIETHV